MIISKIKNVKIEAISAVVPKDEIDNVEYAYDLYGVKDDDKKKKSVESLIKSIEISKRRVCKSENITSLDLGIKAAKNIFEKMNFCKEEFGGIVFVTESPDDLCPNNSTYVQSLLGLDENISAIDIVHACPGYIYGLWNSALIANNMNKKVLLLVAETNSYFVSPYDKVTGPLFGDAGTATVISPSETGEEWKFAFFTDSSKRNALIIPGFGFRQKPSEEKIKYKEYPDGSKRRDHDMYMNGEAVFRYVTQTASKYVKSFMKEVNKTSENYDYAIFHQANAFMLKMLARSLNFSMEKVPLSLDKFGNTNSASIPLNIVSELSNIIIDKKSKILMSGFGAGLATGIADLEIGPCYCTKVIDYE